MRRLYKVSADHIAPEYRRTDEPVLVALDRLDNTWSATAAKLGCGKPCRTPEQAIRSLFQDHACSNITITGPVKSGEYILLSDA